MAIFAVCTILGASIGYCAMLPIIASRLTHWRHQQEIYAQQDLLVIDELARTSPSMITPDVEARIAKGEVRWEQAKKSGDQNLQAHWTDEPGGFERLRMSYQFSRDKTANESKTTDTKNVETTTNQVRTATLVRRFSKEDIANSVGTGLTFVVLSTVAGALVAIASIYFRATRKQELRWLRSIGSVLPSNDYRERRPRIAFVSAPFAESVYAIADALNDQVEQVRASYENSSRAMTNMPIGILSFDNDLQLDFINPAGRNLLHLQHAQEGKSLLEVVRIPAVLDCIQETHKTGKPIEVELERKAEKLWLRLRTHPLTRDTSSPANASDFNDGFSVLLTVIDESRLKQLENLRRDFTANVSHELKTPLAAIKAYSETLMMGAAEDPDACKKFIGRIGEQANRLDSLIQDLLQLTKLQSQPEKPRLQRIRIQDVIQACVEDHRPIAARKSIVWDLDAGIEVKGTEAANWPEIFVNSDVESLKVIFNNLLSNAIRYNREAGKICIQTSVEDGLCRVRIADTGIGIPSADLDRVFERFYRVEKARSQDAGGTGLGLAIVKHLAASIRAKVSVTSELGKGTAFTIDLPLA